MNKQELRSLIKEEISKSLREAKTYQKKTNPKGEVGFLKSGDKNWYWVSNKLAGNLEKALVKKGYKLKESNLKEGRGTGPISKLVRDKYGDDVLNAVYELEETLLSVGAFKNEIDNIADIVFEILDAAYDEGHFDGQMEMGSTD